MTRHASRAAPPTIVRFSEIVPDWASSPAAREEGRHRAVYRYIGGSRDREPRAALPGWEFANGVVMVPPRSGAPLHGHGFEEVFMVWEGAFEVFWEDARDGEAGTVELGRFDAVRIPAGVMRGYRNCGGADGFLYYIHGRGAFEAPAFRREAGKGRSASFVDPRAQVVRYDECPMNFQVYHEASLPEGVRGIRRYAGRVGGELDGVGPPRPCRRGRSPSSSTKTGRARARRCTIIRTWRRRSSLWRRDGRWSGSTRRETRIRRFWSHGTCAGCRQACSGDFGIRAGDGANSTLFRGEAVRGRPRIIRIIPI